jgi:hypothetical protein
MRCTTNTVHESFGLTTHGNALTPLEQVHIPPPGRDNTNDLAPEGEQISSLGCDEVRDPRGKFDVATQQLFEVRRRKCERLKLRDATACLQRRLHVGQIISTRPLPRR